MQSDVFLRDYQATISFFRLAKDVAIPAGFHTLCVLYKNRDEFRRSFLLRRKLFPAGSAFREKKLKISRRGKGIYLSELGRIVSSTGEIAIDAKTKTIRIVTPKSEGFTVTGKSVKGDQLSVSGSSTLCSVFAGSLDGKVLAETFRALILHLTDIQATGRKKTALANSRIVYNWGNMDPYLLRKGKVEISLKNFARESVLIRALDVNGAVLAEVPFREADGIVTFTADTGLHGAMAYEFLRLP